MSLQLHQKDQIHVAFTHCYYSFLHATLCLNQGHQFQQGTHPLTFMLSG